MCRTLRVTSLCDFAVDDVDVATRTPAPVAPRGVPPRGVWSAGDDDDQKNIDE